jgi:hypothetical protein
LCSGDAPHCRVFCGTVRTQQVLRPLSVIESGSYRRGNCSLEPKRSNRREGCRREPLVAVPPMPSCPNWCSKRCLRLLEPPIPNTPLEPPTPRTPRAPIPAAPAPPGCVPQPMSRGAPFPSRS